MLHAEGTVSARRWAVSALGALSEAREEIDELNVFPVPDGDTGTNMYLTLESAVMAAATIPEDAPVSRLADAFARGALLGARGNSGVIGAQMLRGWAQALSARDRLDAQTAVNGLRLADDQAWLAVGDPVEGTILSVSRAAAEAAEEAFEAAADGGERRLRQVVEAAVLAAREALERTPEQLPALAAAGVVDAGGRGFVVVLETLLDLVLGATRNRPGRPGPSDRVVRTRRGPALPAPQLSTCDHLTAGGPGYEVMYLLNAEDSAMARLRPRLSELGDSLVVVGGDGLWNVHVHVHDPGAAIEAALDFGRPHRIRISHFSEHDHQHDHQHERQHERDGDHQQDGAPGAAATDPPDKSPAGQDPSRKHGSDRFGLVACAAGPGLEDLFAGVGAVVVPGGPGRRPSTGQLLGAVRRTGAREVALLPNDSDTRSVAKAAASAARQEGIRVTVLPTRAQVQGLAAAAVHDPRRSYSDDVVAMSAAAGASRDGAVTVAVKDGLTTAGECRKGDVLGVVNGDFAVIGDDLESVAIAVTERLLAGGGELVTLVVGAGGHDGLARSVAAHVQRTEREAGRRVEVSVLDGGQPRYPLLVGVE